MEYKPRPIGEVSKEVIEFAVMKYIEATGEEPNVLLEQKEEIGRSCWVLTIELSHDCLLGRSSGRRAG